MSQRSRLLFIIYLIVNAAFFASKVAELGFIRVEEAAYRAQIKNAVHRQEILNYFCRSLFVEISDRAGAENKFNQQQMENLDISDLRLTGICVSKLRLAYMYNSAFDVSGVFKEGESAWGFEIKQILNDSVLLERYGSVFNLNVSASEAEADCLKKIGDNERLIKKSRLAPLMSGLLDEINFVRIKPHLDLLDKKRDGLKLEDVHESGVLTRLGFSDGDVIESINGMEIYSIPRALQVVESLRSEKYFEINLQRGGAPVMLKLYLQD